MSIPDGPGNGTEPHARRALARWALRDDRTLPPAAKLIWFTLDSRGEDPHPSLPVLAADCGFGVRTAQRMLRLLEAGGWLRAEARVTPRGDADASRYVLGCPGGVVSRVTPPPRIPARGVVSPMSPPVVSRVTP